METNANSDFELMLANLDAEVNNLTSAISKELI